MEVWLQLWFQHIFVKEYVDALHSLSFVDDLRQQQSIVFLGLHALIILQFVVVHFQACE